MYYRSNYNSPLGTMTVICDESNILSVTMDTQQISAKYDSCRDASTHWGQAAANWLEEYFSGKNPAIGILPLMPEGTAFQTVVWELLKQIPYGCTVTYGQLARQVAEICGKENMSAQAVGQAVGANPISIIIPCHRVIGANGKLTGYTGGLEKKIWLLSNEGIII